MKRRMKRIVLTIAITLLSIVTLGLVACNKKTEQDELKIVFKPLAYQYAINGVADAYDFIEVQKGVDYDFSFTYLTKADSGETVSSTAQEINGSTIFLAQSSRYTLYVTATRGEESISDSTTFDVVSEEPVLLPPSMALIYELGSSARLNVLLDKASPTAIPASCDITVDYYTFQENQAPNLESSANTNFKVKTMVGEDESMKRIEFSERGLYEFHMIANNGGKTAEATFKVKVLPDQTAEVEGISAYKNAEFGQKENGDVDSSLIRLTGSTDIAKASYAVLEDQFTVGQVARFEFYGQNMPSYIGIMNQDAPGATEPNSLKSGYGYMLTTEYSTPALRVYGYLRRREGTASLRKTVESVPIEHFGFSDLEDGKHYFFEIAVKKTGTLSYKDSTKVKADGSPDNTWKWGSGDDTRMLEHVKDKYVQGISLHFSLYEQYEDGSYGIVRHSSIERFEKSIGGSWFVDGEEVVGKLVAYSSISKDVTFKYYKDTLLDNTTFDKSAYSYDEDTNVMTWEPVDGAVNYVITAGDISSNRLAVIPASKTSFDFTEIYDRMEPFEELNINVYASIGNNTFSECRYEHVLLKGTAGLDNVSVLGTVVGAENGKLSVKLAGASANKAAHFQTDVEYVAFHDNYVLNENGTYIDVYFMGNNMPQVEFFATDVNKSIKNKDGDTTSKGFIVTNGHARQEAYLETSMGGYGYYSNYALFYKYGVTDYNRVADGNSLRGATYAGVDGTYSYTTPAGEAKSHDYSNFSMYSLMKAQSSTQSYRYTVGMFTASQNGSVWIDAKLYKVNGNSEELFASWLAPVTIDSANAQTAVANGQTIAGKIVLHSAYKGSATNSGDNYYTYFTCSKPYAGQAATTYTTLLSKGEQNPTTGEVTLTGGAYYSSSSYEKNAGYIAFKNGASDKYTLDENGWYMDFNFTGNNMPNVEFFGNSISGNMFKTDGDVGYLVTNGNASRNTYNYLKEVRENNLFNTDMTQAYINGTFDWEVSNTNGYKYNGFIGYESFFKFGVSNYEKYSQNTYLVSNADQALTYSLLSNGAWVKDRTLNYSKLSMFELMKDETKQWHYVVGMYLDGDKVCVDAKLYEVVGTAETLYASYNAEVETLTSGVVRSGYIVVHAALKGAQSFVGDYSKNTFTYTAPYAGDASARA